MSEPIITESPLPATEGMTFGPVPVRGFLAFSRTPGCPWIMAPAQVMTGFPSCIPYPLHESRESAVEAIRRYHPNGGEGRIIPIEF